MCIHAQAPSLVVDLLQAPPYCHHAYKLQLPKFEQVAPKFLVETTPPHFHDQGPLFKQTTFLNS